MGTVNQDGSAVIMRLRSGHYYSFRKIEESDSHLSPVLTMQPSFETWHFEHLQSKVIIVAMV